MRFTNTLRLLVKNFKQALNLFLSKSVMALVVSVLCLAFIMPELIEIAESAATVELLDNFKNIFFSLIDHETGKNPSYYVDAIFNADGSLSKFLDLIFSMRWELLLAAAACVLVYLIKCFVDEVLHFTVGSMINDKMSTYAETPFVTSLVSNLGKASKYAGVHVAVTALLEVGAIVLICIFLRFLNLFFAAFLSVTLVVCLHAIKLALTGHWMPAMTADNQKLTDAMRLKEVYGKKRFFKSFILYVVIIYIVIIVNVVAALCTFGSALLLTVPASYLLFICAQYVNYYTMQGKKYFITYENIATNPDRGDRAHFFEYIEEAEKAKEDVSGSNVAEELPKEE